jgi:hypothetical protein
MRIAEVQLDHAFAEKVESSAEFVKFLLTAGRFSRFAENAMLLLEEQSQARKAKYWWKHWWCRLPDGTESETDLFLVFECSGERFSIHIENKTLDGVIDINQAVGYRKRATFKANQSKWLSYTDYETILMAPQAFLDANEQCVAQFDRSIPYEEIGNFIPLFAQAAAVT